MAGSRLDRIGTIFSRTTGLLKAGAVRYQDRPVWYDVYRVFPPKYEPHYDREPEQKEIMEIMYKEDTFRAKYYKKYGLNPGGIVRKLNDRNFEDPTQSFVTTCFEMKKSRPEWDDDQIFNAALETQGNPPTRQRSGRSQTPTGTEINAEMLGMEADEEAEAAKRHGRKPPTITVQSLRSLFEEAQEQQQKSAAPNKTDSGTSTEPKS